MSNEEEIHSLELPPGVTYVPERGLVVSGIVARDLLRHPIGPRPGRNYDSCVFNDLADNTALSMFVGDVEPGKTKCGHRHFDETLMYFISGTGRSEFRQDDDAPMTHVEWKAGDLLVIPANAWHEHFNDLDNPPARFLSFKTAKITDRLISSATGPILKAVRLRDRYDDEPDYFTRRTTGPDGVVAANFVAAFGDDPMPEPQDGLGEGVAIQRYSLGGQLILDVSQVTIAAAGAVRAHRPWVEEALLVLGGEGSTDVWMQDADRKSVSWRAGDMVTCPLGVWRTHSNTGHDEVRLLRVRCVFAEQGHAVPYAALDAEVGPRWPTVVDPVAEEQGS